MSVKNTVIIKEFDINCNLKNLNHKSSFIRSFASTDNMMDENCLKNFQLFIFSRYKPYTYLNQNADIICSYTVELTIAMVYLKGHNRIKKNTAVYNN